MGRSPEYKALGCLSVGVWANFGMVAMSVNAIERYAVVMEPIIICLLCAGGMLALRAGGDRLPGHWSWKAWPKDLAAQIIEHTIFLRKT